MWIICIILPLKKDFTRKTQFPVHFVGHPLIDAISSRTEVSDEVFGKKIIYRQTNSTLLPGSRKQRNCKMLDYAFGCKRFFGLSVCNCWRSKVRIWFYKKRF